MVYSLMNWWKESLSKELFFEALISCMSPFSVTNFSPILCEIFIHQYLERVISKGTFFDRFIFCPFCRVNGRFHLEFGKVSPKSDERKVGNSNLIVYS